MKDLDFKQNFFLTFFRLYFENKKTEMYPTDNNYYNNNNYNSNMAPYPSNNNGYPQPDYSTGYNNNNDNNSYPSYPNINDNNNNGFYQIPGYNSNNNTNNNYPGQSFPSYPDNNFSNNNYPGYPPQTQNQNYGDSTYDQSQNNFNNNSYPNQAQNNNYADTYQNNNNFPGYPPSTNDSFNNYPANQVGASNFGDNSTGLYPTISNQSFNQSSAPIDPYGQSQQSFQPIQNINYIPSIQLNGPFDPNSDATRLYKAMKGFGTNEKELIDVLCNRTSDQRQQIITSYKSSYGKDLQKDIKSETGGKFQDLMLALLLPTSHLEALDVKRAIDGLGTDELSLIDILCTKSNTEMEQLKAAYRQVVRRDLERDVGGDVSGYFKRILVSVSAANRSMQPADYGRAVQQANELHKAGVKKFGTDEVTFNRIFAVESFDHLRVVFSEYQKIANHSIEHAIKAEMSGDVEAAFLAIAQVAQNPPVYWAKRLHDSMSGMGTRDHILIRIMVLRSEKDMMNIKQEFQRMYKKTLESFIKVNIFKVFNNRKIQNF
jgi:annexin A7/11